MSKEYEDLNNKGPTIQLRVEKMERDTARQAGGSSGGQMLLLYRGVPDRQLKAMEVHHPRSRIQVGFVQRGPHKPVT